MTTKIEVYTDGSATVATKPGGYGWVLVIDGVKFSEGNGHMERASNNDAELEAAIRGLLAALRHIMSTSQMPSSMIPENTYDVTLVSDSEIILGWANGQYRFKQVDKLDKYNQLKTLMQKLKAKTRWVEGHSGDEHNERCDKLANLGRQQLGTTEEIQKPKKKKKPKSDKSGMFSVWYKGKLKIVDLESNTVQDHSEEVHGPASSRLEIL